ncbi:hypothetical protein THASP1DRAFT_33763 [Thamnocephalis sphaerospora]|uniref:URB1 N-terminal domain-containing protein n=1 Tax=Thamnocephalis sphaerospora TaxID=78915 RepID=A0A4V1IVL4_9FUNG|nr:hypothetical protein THASP1DRAFT_33763 [Thamnocephalis sphaerospora]|eukprot:RKP04469.1 hypothetical protein THASP1DRAFT_33763 [Thamnocephalis sphaerospora]
MSSVTALPATTTGLYDPTAFTTITDLYAVLKDNQLGAFERALTCLKYELEARAAAAPGIGLLDAYLRSCDSQELLRLWDRVRELEDIGLEILLAASFREILARCSLLADLSTIGAALARAITQDRLKLVYRLLSSNRKDANMVALGLLTAMNAQGVQSTNELYASFNFSLNVLISNAAKDM